MTRTVSIVALSARTAVGLRAESSAAAVRAGVSRVREHPFIVDATGEKLKCAFVGALDPTLLGPRRVLSLARGALLEIVNKLTARGPYPDRIPVLLALPEVRPGFSADHARFIQQQLTADEFPGVAGLLVERGGEGHAGALRALETAGQRVASGQHELCIIGGADSYLEADTLDWLDADRRLLRAEIRSGFPPGEGASMLALASNSARRELGLPVLATVRSVATAHETRRADSQEGLLGEALTEAFTRAGRGLGPRELFQDIYCDINGERDRTDDYGFALLRTSQLFRDGTAYSMSTTQCGDLGAASAAFHCVLATRAWQRGYARGPTALVWGASWTGLRGAALLDQSAG
jgi:3-oxoacyl-[acyl-carrier-protein] synthase-1